MEQEFESQIMKQEYKLKVMEHKSRIDKIRQKVKESDHEEWRVTSQE